MIIDALRRLSRRIGRDDRGFTMVTVMGAMLVLGTFTAAAWSAANGDLPLARKDQDRKAAYEAAEAGVQWYTHQLEQSTNFWSTCTPTTQGVNMKGSRTSWRTVTGSDPSDQERFAIEVLPVQGKTCDPNKLDTTMLDNGVLRIRSTGTFRDQTRQIVTSFRRDGFLDFVWYTVRETAPPASYNGSDTSPDWVQKHCDFVRSQRPNGNQDDGEHCAIIDFITNDWIKGPMHTEDDSFSYTGSPGPKFGRDTDDKIEVSGAGTTYDNAFRPNGSGGYRNLGTLVAPGKTVAPPGNNFALRNFADIILKGNSCVRFNGNGTVTTWSELPDWGYADTQHKIPNYKLSCPDAAGQTQDLKDGTVIWVDNAGTCSGGYQKAQKYVGDLCGNVAVWGKYDANVTIGAANDVIVAGDTTRVSDSDDWLLGLVANQFVRVYHPMQFASGSNTCGSSTKGAYTSAPVTKITAAILATQGSFLTDNWYCAAPLGSLRVLGTIAQYWRGAVGTSSGGTAQTGYAKDYTYDNRLKYREPPQFLDPGTSQWHVLRQGEQVPVATG
jgi:Tfp pilus assembly protein PilE